MKPESQSLRLPLRVASALTGLSVSTLQRRCRAGELIATRLPGNGGEQYIVDLASLPHEAQLRFFAGQVRDLPPAQRLEAIQQLPMPDDDRRSVARQTRTTLKPRPAAPAALTPEEREAAHAAFERSPSSVQAVAEYRVSVMLKFAALDPLLSLKERFRIIAAETSCTVDTLRRWRLGIKNLDRSDWAPALAPAWGTTAPPKAELSEEAWQFILNEWACQSQPALKSIYRRAQKEAAAQGWSLPSYKTILRRIAVLPVQQRAWLREGEKGLDRFYPALTRNYATLALHQMWCSDGRKADVFCEWPDGHVGRPIVVAWQELRSRKILGWAIGRTETAELARLAFHHAASASRAVPQSAYMDNGRAYAAKEMTGGQAKRNRFKINESDPLGMLTALCIEAIWATPYNGRSKPIESYWNTIAQAERCKAFAGSYCGNRPDAKPEEFARGAIPIADYEALLRETIEAKNAEPHRGSGMDGRSPNEVYAALLPGTQVREPTERQLRMCLLAVESVKLDKSHSFSVLRNRYWAEGLAQLDRGQVYQARYNPADMSEPVALYAGRKLLAEVPLWQEGDFRSRTAAKTHARARNILKKLQREQAKALLHTERTLRSWEPGEPESRTVIVGDGAPVPAPKVAQPVRMQLELRVDRSKLRTAADADHDRAESEADFERGLQKRLEGFRRANGAE